MIKQQMKALLFAMLGEDFLGTDFRLKRSEDAFVRKIAGGNQTIGLTLWDYNPNFQFSLNVTIRLDAVEEIFNQLVEYLKTYQVRSE